VRRAVTDGERHAPVAVPPGRYVLTAAMGQSLGSRLEIASIQVRGGRITHVRFAFDTGIRWSRLADASKFLG
jgi:hypothetical protein